MGTPAIATEGLEKSFGEGRLEVRAVRGVTFEVHPGEVVLIMGPSGSGKTTLLSMLGAMMRPTGGTVRIDGEDILDRSEREIRLLRAHRFGFVFQDYNLLGSLSALENVMVALDLAGADRDTARERAEHLLAKVGLSERLRARPKDLSGGEQQRVAIARALANDPIVILADEPTASLDSGAGRGIARLLRRSAADGRAVVIVSHDERLREIADRVLWLEDGRFAAAEATTVDPVCRMVVPRGSRWHAQWDDDVFRFCSEGCRDEFLSDPPRYILRVRDPLLP
jgi:putative ABC transport system ATP-binding protein